MTEFLAKNSDISPVIKVVPLEILYKSDSNTDALSAISQIIGKTHKNICGGDGFQYIHEWQIGDLKLPKRNSTNHLFLDFLKTFSFSVPLLENA